MENTQEKQLAKAGEFELDIVSVQRMVKEYQTLTLVPDDSESYGVCRTALTACVRVRTGIDKRRLELNADAQKLIKNRNSVAKELASLIAPAEDHLSALVKGEDARKAAIEAEMERLENVKIQGWIDALLKVGVNMEWFTVATMTEKDFNVFYTTARTNFEAEQSRFAEAEKARLERDAAEKAEREAETKRLADQKAEQDAERAELDRIRKEIEAGKQAIADAARRHQEKIDAAEKAIQEAKDRAEFERQAEERAKAQAEKEAKESAERALEAEKQAKAEAERQEALKPIVERLYSFADSLLEVPVPTFDDEGATKVIAFATREISNLRIKIKLLAEEL